MMRSGAESGGAGECTSPTRVVLLFTCEPVLRPYRCIVADCVFGCHVDRVDSGNCSASFLMPLCGAFQCARPTTPRRPLRQGTVVGTDTGRTMHGAPAGLPPPPFLQRA